MKSLKKAGASERVPVVDIASVLFRTESTGKQYLRFEYFIERTGWTQVATAIKAELRRGQTALVTSKTEGSTLGAHKKGLVSSSFPEST